MNYDNGPPQPGYAPSNTGGNYMPQNPGYAPSQVSAPPPGMGGQQPQYNDPNYQSVHPAHAENCFSRNNPFEKANSVTDDIYFNATYKKVMGIGIVSICVAIIGSLVVTSEKCLYINVAPAFHLVPIFMPSCNRFFVPFQWSIICMASVILMGVTLGFGLLQGCAAEAAIMFAITVAVEGLGVYFLYKMDPTLKDKIKYCFASCGCCGSEAQMQTMVPKETTYNTQNPGQPGGGGIQNYGYDGHSQLGPAQGGLGPGSYVGDRTGGANAYQAPGSVASGYSYNYPHQTSASMPQAPLQTPAPPGSVMSGGSASSPRPGERYQSDTLRSSKGKGGFMIDAPAEYDGGSRLGY